MSRGGPSLDSDDSATRGAASRPGRQSAPGEGPDALSRASVASQAQGDGGRWGLLPKPPRGGVDPEQSMSARRTLRLLLRGLRRAMDSEEPAPRRSRHRD